MAPLFQGARKQLIAFCEVALMYPLASQGTNKRNCELLNPEQFYVSVIRLLDFYFSGMAFL